MGSRQGYKHGTLMYIDPGLAGTGWAVFDGKPKKKSLYYRNYLIESHAFVARGDEWTDRLTTYTEQLMQIVSHFEPRLVVVEFPELWTGSVLSQASAGSGDLFKLAALCGAIKYACDTCQQYHVPCEFKHPREWKGQLKKEEVLRRIKNKLQLEPRNHEGDAIGMGLSLHLGEL